MGNKNVITERLSEAFFALGTSNREVAEKLDCDTSTITKLINGDRKPSAEMLLKICRVSGISSDYLLGLSDVKHSTADIKPICDTTGLSENLVAFLTKAPENSRFSLAKYDYNYYYGSSAEAARLINAITEHKDFFALCARFCELGDTVERAFSKLKNDVEAAKDDLSVTTLETKGFSVLSKYDIVSYKAINLIELFKAIIYSSLRVDEYLSAYRAENGAVKTLSFSTDDINAIREAADNGEHN